MTNITKKALISLTSKETYKEFLQNKVVSYPIGKKIGREETGNS